MQVVRREQGAHGNRLIDSAEGLTREIGVQFNLFGSFGSQTNFGHLDHGFKGKFTRSCFCTQHHGIGAIQHGVGHVAHFGTGGYGVGDHAFHHLSGRDNHLVVGPRQLDHALLQGRYNGVTNLHRQITTGYHDAVAGKQNFFQTGDGFCSLNFGNQPGLVVELSRGHIGQLAGHFHVGGIFGEAHGHIVGLKTHGRFDVFHVLGGEGWRSEAAALFVDALVVGQLTTQFDGGVDFFALHRIDGEHNQTIVE